MVDRGNLLGNRACARLAWKLLDPRFLNKTKFLWLIQQSLAVSKELVLIAIAYDILALLLPVRNISKQGQFKLYYLRSLVCSF